MRRRSNGKKIIAAVGIFIVAFLIIFISALITKDAGKKKEKTLAQNPNQKEQVIEENPVSNVAETKNEEAVENTVVDENKLEAENVIPSNREEGAEKKEESDTTSEVTINTTKKTTSSVRVSGGKLPVSNSDSIALCKAAQTSHEKNIYLTFDDGPSPNITPQILEILDRYNVPATFFVLGSRVELYPELLRQEYEAGHYIANHGYTHTYSAIYSSIQSVLDEYNNTEKAIQDALGLPEFHSYLFRFPGGSSGGPYNDLKQEAKTKLESMGIASTNWNCLNGDAEGGTKTKQQLLDRLYQTADGWTSLVVLMHDANDKQTTADALPEIIEHYQNEGYTFKNYYDIFQ